MDRQPTRAEVRSVACPVCKASPGHPCVEHRTTGHHGKHLGRVREANHAGRAIHLRVCLRTGTMPPCYTGSCSRRNMDGGCDVPGCKEPACL